MSATECGTGRPSASQFAPVAVRSRCGFAACRRLADRVGADHRKRNAAVVTLLIFAAGAAVLLFRLGTARSVGSHEAYAIVPAHAMAGGGDWVVPEFCGLPRLKKPPLIYWAIAGTAKLFGTWNITIARLPAAAAAFLLAVLMAAWGRQWYGTAGAWGAAAAQFTSVYVVSYGRKAEADLPLCLLVTAALWLYATWRPDESEHSTRRRWLGIWACAAAAWLAKFQFGPAMIAAPLLASVVLEKRRRFLRCGLHPVGIAIFAAAVTVWPALVLARMPEAWLVWRTETLGRVTGELGSRWPGYYLPHLFAWTLPWPALWLAAWPGSLRAALGKACSGAMPPRRRWDVLLATGDFRERFLWVWLLVPLAMLSLSAGKHSHYLLPILPAFSLWTARRFADIAATLAAGRSPISSRAARTYTALLFVIAGAASLAVRGGWSDVPPALLVVLWPAAGGVTATVWLLNRRRAAWAGLAIGVTLTGSLLAAHGSLLPAVDERGAAYAAGEELRRSLGPVPVAVYGLGEDYFTFCLGGPVVRIESPEALAAEMLRSPERLVVAHAGYRLLLEQHGNVDSLRMVCDAPGESIQIDHYRQLTLFRVRRSGSGGEITGRGDAPRR